MGRVVQVRSLLNRAVDEGGADNGLARKAAYDAFILWYSAFTNGSLAAQSAHHDWWMRGVVGPSEIEDENVGNDVWITRRLADSMTNGVIEVGWVADLEDVLVHRDRESALLAAARG